MVMMIWTCVVTALRWRVSRVSLGQARAARAMLACGHGSCGYLSQARARASVAPAARPLRPLHRKQLCLAAAGTHWPRKPGNAGRHHRDGANAPQLQSSLLGTREARKNGLCLLPESPALRFVTPAKRNLTVPRRRTQSPPYAWGPHPSMRAARLENTKDQRLWRARDPNAAKELAVCTTRARAVQGQVKGSPRAKGSHAGHAAHAGRQPAGFAAALPRRAGRRSPKICDGKENAQGRASRSELPQVAFR